MDRNTVLYDDECSFCTFQMKLLSWLDWGSRFALIPASDSRVKLLAPELTAQQLNEAIHCVTTKSGIHRGARAIRFISLRLPLLWPLALLLWLPGVILFAERAYVVISRNRQHISRLFGCKGACAVMPHRAGMETKSPSSGP